jgi:hypothetical protein
MAFTIIEVLRDLQIEPDKSLTWGLGTAVAAEFRKQTGEMPPIRRQPKTDRNASHPPKHAICTYPEWFRPIVLNLVRQRRTEAVRQGDLFELRPHGQERAAG